MFKQIDFYKFTISVCNGFVFDIFTIKIKLYVIEINMETEVNN